MARLFVCLAAVLLSGCATLVNGTSQTVAVNSTPQGASCSVDRSGSTLSSIAATPSIVPVSKSVNSLIVTCSKPGYKTAHDVGQLIVRRLDLGRWADRRRRGCVDRSLLPLPALGRRHHGEGPANPAISSRSEQAGPTLGSIAARSLMTTRAMAQPSGSRSRLTFLQGACSAGDESACIVAEADHPGAGSRRSRHN